MRQISHYWHLLGDSLWFIPGVIVTGFIFLALALIQIDIRLMAAEWAAPTTLSFGPDAARSVLTTIASSTITVAGVAFSITIVTLSLASTQYTSRILRNFIGDRTNQFVLGVFIGVYAYALIVLRTVRSTEEGHFVPVIAVSATIVLGLVAVGFLIAFIHHIASSIQASHIISSIAKESIATIERLFPEHVLYDEDHLHAEDDEKLTHGLRIRKTGYIQAIDLSELDEIATNADLHLRLSQRTGQFVVKGDVIASFEGHLDEHTQKRVGDCVQLGSFRTIYQDPGFGIRQIVDIALKALSPGVNDSTTAITAVDHLSAILVALATRSLQHKEAQKKGQNEAQNTARVQLQYVPFARYVEKACDQIRQYSTDNTSVQVRLLAALTRVASAVTVSQRLDVIEQQAHAVLNAASLSGRGGEGLLPLRQYLGQLTLIIEQKRSDLSVTDSSQPTPRSS